MRGKVLPRFVLLVWIVVSTAAAAGVRDGHLKRSSARKPIVFVRLRANGSFGISRTAHPDGDFSDLGEVPEVHSPLYENESSESGSLRSVIHTNTDETTNPSDTFGLLRSSINLDSLKRKSSAIIILDDNGLLGQSEDGNSSGEQSNRNVDTLSEQINGDDFTTGQSSGSDDTFPEQPVVTNLPDGNGEPLPELVVDDSTISENSESSPKQTNDNEDYPVPVISSIGICEKPNEHQQKIAIDSSEAGCKQFVKRIWPDLKKQLRQKAKASWQLKTNETEHSFNSYKDAHDQHASFLRGVSKRLRRYNTTHFQDKDLKRTVRNLRKCGYSALPCNSYEELQQSLKGMKNNYATAKVCKYGDDKSCDLPLRPHVENIMATCRDPEELQHYWTQWHQKAGKPSKPLFHKYVELASDAASLNGFPSMSDYWLDAYEHRRFKEELSIAKDKIAALYMQLHAYVRYHIRQTYGARHQEEYGPIQLHLLGDMSGQNWENVASLAMPYPEYHPLDVTEEMLVQRHTPTKMFRLADEFLQSLNMSALPKSFYKNCAVKQLSQHSEESCEASVHDMFDRNDVRIKMCPKINHHDLSSVHSLVAQAQYSMQYQNQPTIYRKPACPGFQDAIGQLISLSATTPRNLERTNLLCKSYRNTHERKINRLFVTALQKLPQLPFIYSVEKFRMKAFRRTISKEDYNCRFWQLRSKYAGVEPPVNRTNEDFDPAALSQVSSDTETMQRYFATIAQFQMHKALCRLPGKHHCRTRSELSDCNIFDSKRVGEALKGVLRAGASKPWPKLMEELTGYKGLTAGPLVDYFHPLYEWLVQFNMKNRVPLGWSESTRCPCESRNGEDEA